MATIKMNNKIAEITKVNKDFFQVAVTGVIGCGNKTATYTATVPAEGRKVNSSEQSIFYDALSILSDKGYSFMF